jgi:hypothetical protein
MKYVSLEILSEDRPTGLEIPVCQGLSLTYKQVKEIHARCVLFPNHLYLNNCRNIKFNLDTLKPNTEQKLTSETLFLYILSVLPKSINLSEYRGDDRTLINLITEKFRSYIVSDIRTHIYLNNAKILDLERFPLIWEYMISSFDYVEKRIKRMDNMLVELNELKDMNDALERESETMSELVPGIIKAILRERLTYL